MTDLKNRRVKIYSDGADNKRILDLNANPLIKGITTNPTLMRKAGVRDYETFAKDVLESIRDKPISFEVFSDEFPEMRRQALQISRWGDNVYVKLPITNTRQESTLPLVHDLSREGVKLNITAILALEQVGGVAQVLNPKVPSVVSIFAGRIADTGRDPVPVMQAARALLHGQPKAELLWASVREVLNIFQAELSGCQIVTVPHDILSKALELVGRDLSRLSLETVCMFRQDAISAGLTL